MAAIIKSAIPSHARGAASAAAVATAATVAEKAPPHTVRLYRYLKVLYALLRTNHLIHQKDLFLDDTAQKRLGVECSDLDLAGDGAGTYVTPIALDVMNDWLARSQPWKQRGFGAGRQTDEWWSARHIGNDVITYACTGLDIYDTDIPVNNAHWDESFRSMPGLWWRSDGVWFDTDGLLNYPDKSFPHIHAVLCRGVPLPADGELSAIEVMSIVQLTYYRVKDPVYKSHHIIPVSLISIAGCSVRVLHARIDGATQRVHIQKTAAVDLSEPGSCKKEEWTRLLCWYLATPRAVEKPV